MSEFCGHQDPAASSSGPLRTGTSTGPVAWLHVPYAEKDQAKALGARWDAPARSWYVPAGRDLAPFARWLPTEPAVDLDAPGPRLAVWVVGLADHCWKCQQLTVNVVGLLPQDAGESVPASCASVRRVAPRGWWIASARRATAWLGGPGGWEGGST
jgi:hypothetical protein